MLDNHSRLLSCLEAGTNIRFVKMKRDGPISGPTSSTVPLIAVRMLRRLKHFDRRPFGIQVGPESKAIPKNLIVAAIWVFVIHIVPGSDHRLVFLSRMPHTVFWGARM